MSSHFLDDLDVVDSTTVEATGPAYPVAQWLHGDPKMAAAGGVAHTGGLILPIKYLDDNLVPAPGWSRATVAFSSGKSEVVMATQKPRLAVIRTRFRWFAVHNGVTTYYPRAGYVSDSGMRGHVQALCGVHGFDFPMVVTFKGKASQEFERQLREFSQKVQEAAQRLSKGKDSSGSAAAMSDAGAHMSAATNSGTKGNGQGLQRFPRFAFYMRLSPGPHVKVGQNGQESIITPPVLELPNAITDEYLEKTYVGRERLMAYQQNFHEAAEWATGWDRPGAEETTLDAFELEPDIAEQS